MNSVGSSIWLEKLVFLLSRRSLTSHDMSIHWLTLLLLYCRTLKISLIAYHVNISLSIILHSGCIRFSAIEVAFLFLVSKICYYITCYLSLFIICYFLKQKLYYAYFKIPLISLTCQMTVICSYVFWILLEPLLHLKRFFHRQHKMEQDISLYKSIDK